MLLRWGRLALVLAFLWEAHLFSSVVQTLPWWCTMSNALHTFVPWLFVCPHTMFAIPDNNNNNNNWWAEGVLVLAGSAQSAWQALCSKCGICALPGKLSLLPCFVIPFTFIWMYRRVPQMLLHARGYMPIWLQWRVIPNCCSPFYFRSRNLWRIESRFQFQKQGKESMTNRLQHWDA